MLSAFVEVLPAWARYCEALGTKDNCGSPLALQELESGFPSFSQFPLNSLPFHWHIKNP